MNLNNHIDDVDLKILSILIKNANTHHKDIAKTLEVSNATVHVRVKKMIETGVIIGSNLEIDCQKIGFSVCAFMGIYLDKASDYQNVVSAFERIKQIVELHYCTGGYSIFAKIICRDTQELREVLNEKIQSINGIQRTETFISLEERIKRNISL